jgi:hypothetical protein
MRALRGWDLRIALPIFVLCASLCRGQIGSGTVIILDFAKEKLAIAADSRVTYEDRPPDDSYCKIEVFRNRIVFSEMGAIGFRRGPLDPRPGWFNPDLARRSVREMASLDKDPDSEIKDIASIWANTLAAYWRSAYQTDRAAVERAIAASHNGPITGAVFAEARNGNIHWRFVAVGLFPQMNPEIQAITGEMHDCWPCGEGEKVCAMARPAIPEEFCKQTSPRAKDEAANWTPSPELAASVSRETLHAIRLVDDAIAFDPIKGLGGPVDALELRKDGTIRWVYRKPDCAENEE